MHRRSFWSALLWWWWWRQSTIGHNTPIQLQLAKINTFDVFGSTTFCTYYSYISVMVSTYKIVHTAVVFCSEIVAVSIRHAHTYMYVGLYNIHTEARFPLPELTARVNSPSWRVTSFHYPSTRAVNSGRQLE